MMLILMMLDDPSTPPVDPKENRCKFRYKGVFINTEIDETA